MVCVIVVRSERWKAGEHPERASERAEGADFGDGKKSTLPATHKSTVIGAEASILLFCPFFALNVDSSVCGTSEAGLSRVSQEDDSGTA